MRDFLAVFTLWIFICVATNRLGSVINLVDPSILFRPHSPAADDLPQRVAAGGGIEIASAATVSLDSDTVNNAILNEITFNAVGSPPVLGTDNIDGTYTLV